MTEIFLTVQGSLGYLNMSKICSFLRENTQIVNGSSARDCMKGSGKARGALETISA
jgi:hypothetical protein